MTAHELADKLQELDSKLHLIELFKSATMLRKQQAEIEALKKSCLDEIFKRTYANQSAKVMEGYWQEAQAEIEALKLRELSDEEIIEIASPMFVDVRYPSTALEFARAILKKAREK